MCRDWTRTTKIPKRIAKRRAELESEGYQVQTHGQRLSADLSH